MKQEVLWVACGKKHNTFYRFGGEGGSPDHATVTKELFIGAGLWFSLVID